MNYTDIKEFAAEIAEISADQSEQQARAAGYRDIYDLLMSDRDHPRQINFLLAITDAFNPSERRSLLNGLAREYAGAAGWLEYCERHPNGNGKAARLADFNHDTFD